MPGNCRSIRRCLRLTFDHLMNADLQIHICSRRVPAIEYKVALVGGHHGDIGGHLFLVRQDSGNEFNALGILFCCIGGDSRWIEDQRRLALSRNVKCQRAVGQKLRPRVRCFGFNNSDCICRPRHPRHPGDEIG
ncbi:hypothetical protein LAX5112_04707 [Roseibium alexandrii]|uniref:Uncharacterized protein n=1 Tax=Roseibium alexandrii TaxID=388408 RepID=A0A0M7APH2_9HYPH|nr:hypothetical protein LAX5112_04707 [Roseibium alexandrii]